MDTKDLAIALEEALDKDGMPYSYENGLMHKIRRIYQFEDFGGGMFTLNNGIVLRMEDGSEFCLEITQRR